MADVMADNVIWILVAGVIIGALLIHFYVWRKYHYICSKCHRSFKPSFLRSLIAVNAAEDRKLRCPNCNSTEYMKALKDEKKHAK